MKKLLPTICALFLSLSAFSQSFTTTKISDSSETSTLEVTNAKKPLIIVDYKSEKIRLDAFTKNFTLSDIELHHVERFEVLKGVSAKAKFGNGASDGVILLYLKKNRAAKSAFQDLKRRLDSETLIDTKKKIEVDERTGFAIGKTDEFSTNKAQEPAKLSQLRPSNYEPAAIFIMSLNGQERLIKSPSDLEKLESGALKSVDVLKDRFSKTKYKSNGKDVVIATFNSSKETKRFFRKLKKIKNK